MQKTIKTGDHARFDSFTAGLVPCKVLSIKANGELSGNYMTPGSDIKVEVKITRDQGVFKRGETQQVSGINLVHSKSIRRRKYGTKILNDYYLIND